MSAWPAIPARIEGAGGSIRVRLVKRARGDDGEPCWGTWDESTRTIRLDRYAQSRHRWQTLFHEWTHAALDDAGLSELFSEAGNESLCRAIATARIAQMMADLGLD